jgi:hypothetical protein
VGKYAIAAGALAVLGAVAFLWNAAFTGGPPHARRGAGPAGSKATADRRTPTAELPVKDGVAEAPDFLAPEAARGELVWYGQAVDATTRTPVNHAAVVLERLPDRRQWACRATRDGGYFVARVKADPSEERWRIVIETADGRLGVKPVSAAPHAKDIGRVHLHGRGKLEGVAFYSRDVPAEGVQLWIRRFGELVPGAAWIDAATSDEEGRFEFEKLPSARCRRARSTTAWSTRWTSPCTTRRSP